ncbi:GGDEF domain-containing protein [Kutzneria viridogrisea]|uniref:Diguanylate cyclase (GGDEF)-like protein n=2 Tax=Kutzneria viridogrisea TaxID=47990 RepID=A0ABR6BDM7_9PSEU|nr:diguanylate cyclase (GGDEF)-like protein [Kutzneria viridogrisea]
MSMEDNGSTARSAVRIRDVLVTPRDWTLWRQRPRLIAYCLLVESVALIGTFLLARSPSPSEFALLGVLAVLGVVQAELGRQVERVRRRVNGTPHINMTSVWTFAGVLLLPPVLVTALVAVLYAHLAVRSWYRLHRVPAFRTVVNGSVVVLTCYAAHLVLTALGVSGMADALGRGWAGVGAILLTGLVYFVVNAVVILGALNLSSHSVRELFGGWGDNLVELATLCLGTLTALAMATLPALVLLVVPPLLILHRGVLVKQLEVAATRDEKTGLFNTVGWHTLATTELARAERTRQPTGVLMVDLDHFKRVNDTYGHLAGDAALKAVAEAISGAVRAYDSVGRFGGEEFVVLLPGIGEAAVVAVAERIRQAVAGLVVQVPTGDRQRTVTGLSVSIGVAMYPAAGTVVDRLLHAADTALYEAKHTGRNRVLTWR